VNTTILDYDSISGDLRVYQVPAATKPMTTIEIRSASELINEPPCSGFICGEGGGPPYKIFKLDPAGFSDILFPEAIKPGISLEFLANDLSVEGSLSGGGRLVDVAFLIPEPANNAAIAAFLGVCPSIIFFPTKHRKMA
jgi:hypothetical protein